MIIDDLRLVMGSANINDRSMLGNHDSELAICIEGPADRQIDSSFGIVPINQKINEFRRAIFGEHFGVDIPYPISNSNWQTMWTVVSTNSQIFDKVFSSYPSDQYASWKTLRARNKKYSKEDFARLSPYIRGHAVRYPSHFLKDESLLDQRSSEFNTLLLPIYALY